MAFQINKLSTAGILLALSGLAAGSTLPGEDEAEAGPVAQRTAEVSFKQPYAKREDENNAAVVSQLQKLVGPQSQNLAAIQPQAMTYSMAELAEACALGDLYRCPTGSDDAILALLITLVGAHDASLLIGLYPGPAIGIAAELSSYGSNLGLKAVPPYLRPPLNRNIDPYPARVGSNFSTDDCGIEFELLSAEAGYTNLFGLVPLSEPYVGFNPVRFETWYWPPDRDKTRWGFLRAPLLYHANSDVSLRLETSGTVRKWDQNLLEFTAPYEPIDTYAENPQLVYLPIGRHNVDWRAATQISPLFDVIVDGVIAAVNIRSEVQAIKGGVVASRRAAVVLSDEAASAALSPKSQTRFARAMAKFTEVIKVSFKRGSGPLGKAIKKNARQLAKEIFIPLIFEELLDLGLNNLAEPNADDAIEGLQGISVPVARQVLDIVRHVYESNYPFEEGHATDIGFIIDNLDRNLDEIILAILEAGGDLFFAFFSVDTTVTTKTQTITVFDSIPPVITLSGDTLVIEGTDFGGTRLSRSRAQLMEMAENGSSDNCGRDPRITMEAEEFLPLGENIVTFEFKDRGPNPPLEPGQPANYYAPTFEQRINVVDTRPPLMLVPQSKVILSSTSVPLADADIGTPIAIDLVDVNPDTANNIAEPATFEFPAMSRTDVLWSATDQSGNSTDDNDPAFTQTITVKETNEQPIAEVPATAVTTTAVPVDIRLEARDEDIVDGRADPLWFKIETQPEHGEFIAPLYPFFINDFRTRPDSALEGYDPTLDTNSNYIPNLIRTTYCHTNTPPPPGGRVVPRGFVHEAKFVQVSDDGIWHVWDTYFECLAFDDSGLNEYERISRWTAEGDYLGQISIGAGINPTEEAFQLDQNGKLYYSSAVDGGTSSARLHLTGCQVEEGVVFPDGSYRCAGGADFYSFEDSQDGQVDVGRLEYARIDSVRNLAYVYQQGGNNNARIWLYELRASSSTRFVGEVGPKEADGSGDIKTDWAGTIPTMVVGSDGSLYVNDEGRHRIHKFAPPTVDSEGNLVPGEHIGWAGRCDTTTNNACDLDRGRSRGYSCTNETCNVTGALSGSLQGQFDTPSYIAIDKNDVLYIADYENSRVQRLSADGSFAGEAKSTGTGVNTGDEPSFILGNMGMPASIAVNSSQFFVIDRVEKFVHIFGALPFKDITDDAVTVTYVSNQDFPNPLLVDDDHFSFSASDGLDESVPAVATVSVSRNYLPPEDLGVETLPEHGCPAVVWRTNEAGCLMTELDEDTEMAFDLTSYDPNGIIGVDFLGLDTVTYSMVRLPRYGTISGAADSWVYTPNENFYGEDRLIFKANDGHDDSEHATVTFKVNNVNDVPVVDVVFQERVAVGFPALATAVFTDDLSEEYWADVWWGDGSSEGTGEFVANEDEAYIDGVAIIPPPQEGEEGRAVADHVYNQPGEYTVRMCVEDDGQPPLQGCNEAVVTVEPLVSISMTGEVLGDVIPIGDDPNDPDITAMEFEDQFADGAEFTAEVTIRNGEREGGGGLDAEAVQFDMVLPERVNVISVAVDQGTCTQGGADVSCAIGTMIPGQEVIFSVVVTGPGDLIYDEYRYFGGTLSTSSEAVDNDIEIDLTAVVMADVTDSDGDGMSDAFEIDFGLDPTIDDSGGDLDQDGLTNFEEFEAHTSPNNRDTDSDGAIDYQELQAGTNPLKDDYPPQLVIPADILVDAGGLLTPVSVGNAVAVDFRDGVVEPVPDNVGPFPPGRNVVTWRAEDLSGNVIKEYQLVDVVPLVSFAVDQTVAEGVTARARIELNGEAVAYPVIVPYTVSGTALNPGDHNATNGEVRIESGRVADIEIDVVSDGVSEPDETITMVLGAPNNAVHGTNTSHTITVSEQNAQPMVDIQLEQQGRRTSTVLNSGGLTGVLSYVLDDPANFHVFDWSNSDSGLFEPVSANDPAYLIDPQGMLAGMYDLRVAVTDDGAPALTTEASTLVKIVDEYPLLTINEDVDGDGNSDADEGTGDFDGDRIPDYLDNSTFTNVLELNTSNLRLETSPGLRLRLGASSFEAGEPFAGIDEQSVLVDVDHGYPSDIADFEVQGVRPGGTAQVVIPLSSSMPQASVYQHYAFAEWRNFDTTGGDEIGSASGGHGACPSPGSPLYGSGLAVGSSCLQLLITDGGANDSDGVVDGVIRHAGGVAVPVSASRHNVAFPKQRLSGAGEATIVKFRLRSESGDIVLRSLTLSAYGPADDTAIDNVMLVVDTNGDNRLSTSDEVLAEGRFTVDDGELVLVLDEPLEVPAGVTEMLIVYEVLDAS
jgi:hypothetical protein